jgi:hypothetical protein
MLQRDARIYETEQNSNMDGGRFRTPRTARSLSQMYQEAIEIPPTLEAKTADAVGPKETETGQCSGSRGYRKRGTERTDELEEGNWYHSAHLIEEIDQHVYLVKASEEPGAETNMYDLPTLIKMFPAYAENCKRFAEEADEFEEDNFIACAVYSLCEPTHKQKRHNIYRRLAYAAGYFDCTELPEYMYSVVRETWSFEGEKFDKFLPTHVRKQRKRRN